VRWHLLRALALRLDSWGNVQCRNIISGYIDYLYKNYSNLFYGVCNGIPIDEIRNLWKSDAYIQALYSGLENRISLKAVELMSATALL